MMTVSWVFLLFGLFSRSLQLENGLARSPPMGWSSWNHFHRDINETLFYETADAMISSGMARVGYQYINFDGGWWEGVDTGHAVRNSSGFLQYDKVRFPKGMNALADYIHSKGLRFGHYTDGGKHFCNGDAPASEGYEKQDIAQFASWDIDMVKVDACGATEAPEGIVRRWQELLNATGRHILFSDCHNGCMLQPGHPTWEPWCGELTNMWRTSSDIGDSWSRIMNNLDTLVGAGMKAKPGQWNDPDFLEVGNGQLSEAENRAHFSLWCVTSAPLIAGNDIRSMPKPVLEILINREAIAVNQAYSTNAGDRVIQNGTSEIWAKPLPEVVNNAKAFGVVLFNRNDTTEAEITLHFNALNMTDMTQCSVRDLWMENDSTAKGSITM
jgi:alpha-galactosidase